MTKPTCLTEHRNTIEKRHRKEIQADMVQGVKSIGTQDVRAYAIVAITADGNAHCRWDTGSIMPLWAFAPTIQAALAREIEESGVDETWKPDLGERGRPPQLEQ